MATLACVHALGCCSDDNAGATQYQILTWFRDQYAWNMKSVACQLRDRCYLNTKLSKAINSVNPIIISGAVIMYEGCQQQIIQTPWTDLSRKHVFPPDTTSKHHDVIRLECIEVHLYNTPHKASYCRSAMSLLNQSTRISPWLCHTFLPAHHLQHGKNNKCIVSELIKPK
jgi:hypothetical protein